MPVLVHAQETVLAGTVTDATGFVLPGVTVEARGAGDGGPPDVAFTDGVGAFVFHGLPPGTYGVTFALPGFQPGTRRVELRAGAAVALDVVLSVRLEEQVIVGSRAQPRSVTESPVPIDAIPFRDVISQGATTLDYQLRNLVPSFNVAAHPISGAASLVRPASLRNLAHDHMLVMVNGKRRHRSAVLVWFGGVTDGTQGPDISSIPSIALRQVEVLRDGASAQYGSDAIAGVLNFLLKDAREGGSLEFSTGAYGAGDGGAYNVAGNVGLPFGDNGFANLSLEYGNAGPTDRSVQRADAAALIAAGNTAVADPAQPWGNTTSEDDLKLFGNFGRLHANGVQLYGHANYAHRTSAQGFYFRNPNTRANIFSLDGGRTLLVGDVLGRARRRPGRLGGLSHRADHRRQAGSGGLGSGVRRPELLLLPGDRSGWIHSVVQRGDLRPVSGCRRAADHARRPDLGRQRRVRRPPGGLLPVQHRQRFARAGDPAQLRSRSLPAGGGQPQLRRLPGGQRTGPPRRRRRMAGRALHDPRRRAAVVGGRSVRGAGLCLRLQRPAGVSRLHRRDLDPRERRPLRRPGDAAARRPLDARRRPAGRALRRLRRDGERQAVRSIRADGRRLGARRRQHGFRAPTPGQQNTFNVQSTINPETLDLVDSATVPSTFRAAELRGGRPLDPETSTSATAGLVVDTGAFTLTADYFQVDVSNRLALSQNFTLGAHERAQLLSEGITSARTLAFFRFFINDFSTRTRGIDVVSTWTPPGRGGATVLSFALNHTDTEVTAESDLLGAGDVLALERGVPETRWNVAVNQRAGRVGLLGRLHWFGSWVDHLDARSARGADAQVLGGRFIVDVEAGVALARGVMLAAGGQNVFNTYSDRMDLFAARFGLPYSQFTPWGLSGGYYYARLNYGWGG